MEFEVLIGRAIELHTLYGEVEENTNNRNLSDEELALDFVGDVWDLAKLILGYNGTRDISEAEQKLEGQLAECLWSVIVLARLNNIDLEQVFIQTMDEWEQQLSLQG